VSAKTISTIPLRLIEPMAPALDASLPELLKKKAMAAPPSRCMGTSNGGKST